MHTYSRTLITSLLLIFPILGLTQEVADSCPRPDAMRVELDGSTATQAQVLEVQAQIQTYAQAADAYLLCLEQVAQTAPEESLPRLQELYNEVVSERVATVEAYNSQAQIFNARPDVSPYASITSGENCPRPAPYEVTIDGSSADEAAIMEAQAAVRGFANEANANLDCLRDVAQRVTPEEQDRIVELYNAMNNELQTVANGFNEQVRAYRARTEAAASP